MNLGKACRSLASALLSTVLFISSVSIPVSATESSSISVSDPFSNTEMVYEGDGYNITFSLVAVWGGGYNLAVSILNTGDTPIENWFLSFDYAADITNIWNAEVVSVADDGYVVRNAGWNRDILPGETVSFGLAEAGSFPGFPENASIIKSGNAQAQNGHSVAFNYDSEWGEGFVATITISNDSPENIEDWILEFDFDRDITSVWNAVLESHEGDHYVIKRAPETFRISPGQSISFGFIGEGGTSGEMPVDFIFSASEMYGSDHTDPDVTEENPDGPAISGDEEDNDGDGLSNGFEAMIGTDPELEDTDGDLLSDYQELYLTWTDPTLYDTDGNGISDADEDLDGDGLCNLYELGLGTDTAHPDSDRDDLSDYDELYVHYTDPLNPDTDGDTLSDGDDVILGFSPLLPDTDLNGMSDADEKVYQTASNDFPLGDGRGIINVSVSMNVSGNIDKEVEIINVYDFDVQSRNLVGLIGAPIEIRSDADFDSALITFTYDDTMLGETREEDLSLMWYDEENNWCQILDRESVIDPVNNTVSYITTHFSRYNLVDGEQWFNTWNNASEYSGLVFSTPDIVYHPTDYYFIKNVSFYSTNPLDLRVTQMEQALRESALLTSGNIECNIFYKSGYGGHVEGTSAYMNAAHEFFGDLGYYFEPGEGSEIMWSPVKFSNMYEIIDSIIYTVENYPDDDYKAIVVICDGSFTISESQIERCMNDNISIYLIDLTSSTVYDQMVSTNQYAAYIKQFNGSLIGNASGLMELIADDINGIDRNTGYADKDRDGLADVYEAEGMRTQFGELIFTDPYSEYTDGDELTDYQETGRVISITNAYIGRNTNKNVNYIIMSSNPTLDDSDADGLLDDEDPHPLRPEVVEVNLINRYDDCDYLNVNGYYNGGNQGWWPLPSIVPDTEDDIHAEFMSNKDYRINHCGCGLIAATDFELYFASQYEDFSSSIQDITINYSDGEISASDYMSYAERNCEAIYKLDPCYLNYRLGVTVFDIVSGIKTYLDYNNYQYNDVVWAPYNLKPNQKRVVLETIITMISKGIPVIFSYDNTIPEIRISASYVGLETYSNPGIRMYRDDYVRAINQNYNYNLFNDRSPESHFMTIVGYVKYLDDSGNYHYLLKIESWGNIYYIDYDEYADALSYVTNILEIKK